MAKDVKQLASNAPAPSTPGAYLFSEHITPLIFVYLRFYACKWSWEFISINESNGGPKKFLVKLEVIQFFSLSSKSAESSLLNDLNFYYGPNFQIYAIGMANSFSELASDSLRYSIIFRY